MVSITQDSRICSEHFDVSLYIVKPNGTKVLLMEANPVIFGDKIDDCFQIEWLNDLDTVATSHSDITNIELRTCDTVNDKEIWSDHSDATLYNVQSNSAKGKSTEPEGESYMEIDWQNDLSCKRCISDEEGFVTNKRFKGNASAEVPVTNTSLSLPFEGVSDTTSINLLPKRVRYPGDININEIKSEREMSDAISVCQKKVKQQAKEIIALKRKLKAKNNQIATLRGLVNELKKKFALSQHAAESIENTFADDIIELLKEGRKTRSYSDTVRSFALTMNFYSNAAYQYIRRKFGNHLPSLSTLRNWYKNVDGEPGVSVDSLNILKQRVENARTEGKTVFVALMLDEMSIRKQVIWNDHLKQFVGYVDYGTGTVDNENTEEATDALVVLVNTLNGNWNLPLAYYFTNKFTGEEKANVVTQILFDIKETGAEVVSFTFDGAPNNITMAKCLGVDFDNPSLEKEFSFKNPATGKPIYIILDICHMLKLVRNTLGIKGFLYDKNGKVIKWDYIVALEKLQREKYLHLGTKLTHQHVKFHNSKMKVKLATQTLSSSVADAKLSRV